MSDSANTGLLIDLGYCYTFYGNYNESLKYYQKFLATINTSKLSHDATAKYIGYAYLQNGFKKEADYYFNSQTGAYNLAAIYVCRGDKAKAYESLKIFNQEPSFKLISVTRLKTDPMFSGIRNEPEFQKILKDAQAKFQTLHDRVGKWLEEEGKL